MARPTTLTIAVTAIAAAAAVVAAPAQSLAGTYNVRFCPTELSAGPVGPEWSTAAYGTAPGSGTPAGATLRCLDFPNGRTSVAGVGGWLSVSLPGASATARFVPPTGARIVALRATRQVVILANSFAEASVYTSSGRSLDDTTPQRIGGALVHEAQPVTYTADQLDADGAQGIEWGVRCPSALPEQRTQCGGGTYGLLNGTITLADDTPPTLTIAPSGEGDGLVIGWAASDPQSGIRGASIDVDGLRVAEVPQTCTDASARPCLAAVAARTPIRVPAGERRDVTVTVTNGAGDIATQSASLVGAHPQAIPPPAAAPSRVTLRVRVKARSIVLAGQGQGCAAVVVSIPRRGEFAVPVRRGRWSVTVRRRGGNYSARCGVAKATERVRLGQPGSGRQ